MLRKLDAFCSWVRSHLFFDFVFDLLGMFSMAALGAWFAIHVM